MRLRRCTLDRDRVLQDPAVGRGTSCIVCESTRSTPVRTKPFLAGTIPTELVLRRCTDCGTTYLASWGMEYPAELYEYYAREIGKSKEDLYDRINDQRYEAILAEFATETSGRRMLEVGCGYGQWL